MDALPNAEKAKLPLFGLPLSVKDFIDVTGLPTTLVCLEFEYQATQNSSAA